MTHYAADRAAATEPERVPGLKVVHCFADGEDVLGIDTLCDSQGTERLLVTTSRSVYELRGNRLMPLEIAVPGEVIAPPMLPAVPR